MKGLVALCIAVVGTAVAVAGLWSETLPLGVPGEWTWGRLPYTPAGLVWGLLLATVCGGVHLAVAWLGERRMERGSRWEAVLWLGLAVLSASVWLTGVQAGAVEGVGLGKAPYVLYYRRTEGYFWQARYEVTSVREFLQDYERLLAQRDYLHIGTHPPGLTLLHYGELQLLQRCPALVEVALATMPETVRESLQLMQVQSQGAGIPFTRVDAAALWWGALITQLLAVLTIVPLYLWVRVFASRSAAWRAAMFWPLVPAVGVFLPKSDLLYPCVAMTAAYCWRRSWCAQRPAWGYLSGVVLCLGLCLSLAFVPVAALMGAQTLCDPWPARGWQQGIVPVVPNPTARRSERRSAIACLLAGLLGFCSVIAVAAACGLNLPSVWAWNFSNHALFYEHNRRTWLLWLWVNPLELAVAVGVPVVTAAIWGGVRLLRERRWPELREGGLVAFAAVWGLLWLSGKNMGEAARLWIILMPWLTATLAAAFAPGRASPPQTRAATPGPQTLPAPGRLEWGLFLLLQWLGATLTVLRVDGFHFTELPGT